MAKKRAAQQAFPEEIKPICHFHQLPERDFGSVCGLIISFRPVSKSRGLDFQSHITIKDAHNATNTDGDNILDVKLFKRNPQDLPPIDRTGDVIYFKTLKATKWADRRTAMSAWDTSFTLFLTQGLLSSSLRHGHDVVEHFSEGLVVRPATAGDVSTELRKYAFNLGKKLKGPQGYVQEIGHTNVNAQIPIPQRRPQQNAPTTSNCVNQVPQMESFWDKRYVQICQGQHGGSSVMLIGEIVKLFDHYPYLDVYLTDYTSNELLAERTNVQREDYSHYFKGPEGRMTLKIEVHEPTRSWIRENMREGSLAMLRNVQCKIGHGNMTRVGDLEATLWKDKRFPEKIFANKPLQDDVRVQKLMENKREYYGDAMPENAFDALDGDQAADSNMSKSKRRREKEKQKKGKSSVQDGEDDGSTRRREAQSESSRATPTSRAGPINESETDEGATNPRHKSSRPYSAVARAYKIEKNRRVQTSISHKLSTLTEVKHNPKRKMSTIDQETGKQLDLHLPFINVNHKALVRVVDYEPREFWNFTQTTRGSPKKHSKQERCYWSFTLLVTAAETPGRDSAERIVLPLYVDDAAGRELFGVSAVTVKQDTDEDPKNLAQAQEKFYALVGAGLPNAKESSSNETSSSTSPTDGDGPPPFAFWQRQINRGRDQTSTIAMSDPFEACIREYGVRCAICAKGGDAQHLHEPWGHCDRGWIRVWGLHSTKISDSAVSAPARFDRAMGEGSSPAKAINLQSSDDESY